ncbi:MAG: DNA-binding Lrp family transcriptional regulator [Pseudohongiellaceae bacterium]|jgi:DNA-binding Lrp family transcriptional regulator
MDTRTSTIDRTDHAILRELQNDARLSNKELSARVGLAPSSCSVRVQRLVADGVLQGFHAQVDPLAMGIGLQAVISLQLGGHGLGTIHRISKELSELPEVRQLFSLGGSQDLLVHVAVRDPQHLRELVMDRIASHEDVAHMETALLFDHHLSHVQQPLQGSDSAGS